MEQSGIAPPPQFDASVDPDVLLAIWAVMAAAAVVVAVRLAIRDRTALPVVACVGAAVCALNEPIFDVLANLSYANTDAVAYHAFGRAIPWSLVIGYIPWVGLFPYLLFRRMQAGISRAALHRVAAALIGSVLALEIVNEVWWHNWRYYGEAPARGVLGGGVVQMAAMPMLCALMYLLAERVTGWRQSLLGLVFPPLALPMVFAATTFPLYVSNHMRLPAAVDWAAAAIAVTLALGAVPVITGLAARLRPAPEAGS